MVIVIIQKRKKVKKKRKVSEKDTLESSGSQSWKVANGKELGKRFLKSASDSMMVKVTKSSPVQ